MSVATNGIGPAPANGDFAGYVRDQSGNGFDLVAPVDHGRAIYNSGGYVVFDVVDDNYSLTVPAGGWSGTLIIQTTLGVGAYGFSLTDGPYNIHQRADRMPGNEWRRLIITDNVVTQSQAKSFLNDNNDYGTVTNFDNYWSNRTELTKLPAVNTSAATRIAAACFACGNMRSYDPMDFGNMQIIANTWNSCALEAIPFMTFPAATNMNGTWRGNQFLVDVPAGMFDDCPCTNCPNIFANCALSQQSVDNVLISFNNAGTSGGTLGLHGGTNSPPSAAGLAAKAALESRGWTVLVNS
ncbi:MAG: hypothetical protein ROR55_21170 [Devosia sp.]